MSIRATALTAATAALGVGLTVGVAAPSHADSVTINDGDATASLVNIESVTADHRTHQVVVRAKFADLAANPDGGPVSGAIYLDTKPAAAGPEFVLLAGLEDGTDYALVRMRNWKRVGGGLTCTHNLDLDYRSNVARFTASRRCLGTPAKVRVGMRTADQSDGSHPITDWLKSRRAFSRWLARA